jgi:SAM-dependent methyltransferase
MSFEKEYYDFERFWNNPEYSYRINIEKIKITFDYIKPDVASLLDAACGNGIFTNMALERFPKIKITAFDRSETALKYVKAEKFVGSIDAIPFPDCSFDCVTAHDVIEHLPVNVYPKALQELSRVSKKYIIIAVPFDEDLEDNISQCPCCRTIFNNDLHFRSFDKDKMRGLFAGSGFTCVDIKTCEKNTFYLGQKKYGNLFYSQWKKKFRSPICPLCGYKNPADQDPSFTVGTTSEVPQASLIAYLKAIPKRVWPKYSKDYEMVALFERP